MKACLVNVKYSQNLGDGLLTECLEAMLVRHGSEFEDIYSIDLAGRTQYGDGGSSRQTILKQLDTLPDCVRNVVLCITLKAFSLFKWRSHYKERLSGVDVIVIGGGNLLTDVDWNFPTKLGLVLSIANEQKTPVYFYGIGVADHWTTRGLNLITQQLEKADIQQVYVRDLQSKERFEKYFKPVVKTAVNVVRDPGLYVSRVFKFSDKSESVKTVGICVTSALAVRHHSRESVTDDMLLTWYWDLYTCLVDAGYSCLIFTNGSSEDIHFANCLLASCCRHRKNTTIQLDHKNPEELCKSISICSTVIAFRMHALIAAYSYGANIIALKWDGKVDAFMASVGLSGNLVSVKDTIPSELVLRVHDYYKSGPDNCTRSNVIEEANQGVKLLAGHVESRFSGY